MATLTNIPINSRSMNGLITISDGTTVLEDGNITTTGDLSVDNINSNSFTTNNMITNNLLLLRQSTSAVNSALGFTINVNSVLQNMYFNTINRTVELWNDTASTPLLSVDLNDNFIDFGGTARFNSFLPSTAITSGFGSNTFITKGFGDGSYGQLTTTNNWSGSNTFNTTLPSTTITIPSTYNNANFITKGFGDGSYGQLATGNTWTGLNTFPNGIIPCASSSITDIQIGGNNQLKYRRSPSAYNISIGENAIRGYPTIPTYNTGQKNISLGHSSMINIMGGSDNIALGFEALQGADPASFGNISPNRSIAIGSGSQKVSLYGTDNISLGYNCFPNNGSGSYNILLGSNVGAGLTDRNNNVVIGSNAMASTANDNGIVVIGSGALQFAIGPCNSMTAVGQSAGANNSSGNSNSFFGAYSGINNLNGSNNCCFGTYSGRLSSSTGNYMVCIGYDSKAIQSNEFVLGSESYSERADLTLPNKVRLNCNQIVGAVSSYNVSWRTNENIIITSPTTTLIYLPIATASTPLHIGATFNIIRTSASTSNMYIIANTGETINYQGVSVVSFAIDSWVQSVSVCCVGYSAGTDMWAVCRYNNRVTLSTNSNKIQTLSDSSNINYPLCFTSIATTGYNNVYGNNSLTYNPNSQLLTVPNLTTNGTLNMTNKVNLHSYQSYSDVATIYLQFGTNENVIISTTTTTAIVLPLPDDVSDDNIGSTFTLFKAYYGTSIITIIAPPGHYILGNGVWNTTYIFGLNESFLKVTCINNALNKTWAIHSNGWFLSKSDSATVSGTLTFSTNPVFNDASIPTSKIINYGTTLQTTLNSSNVNYPVCFTTLSSGGTLNGMYGNASLYYNPSTSIMTVPNLNVSGNVNISYIQYNTTTFNGIFGTGTITGGTKNLLIGSAGAITTGNNNIIIGDKTGSSGYDTANDNIIIGNQTLSVALGTCNSNVIIGKNNGSGLINSIENTFVGFNISPTQSGISYSTALGSNCVIPSGISYSTAIGYGATVNASNQIVLGRSTEIVKIPGELQTPKLSSSTNITVSNNMIYKKYYLSMVNPTTLTGTTITLSAPLYEYNLINQSTAGVLQLPLSSDIEFGTVLRFRRVITAAAAINLQVQTGSGQSILGRNSVVGATNVTFLTIGTGTVITYASVCYISSNLWAVMD